MTVADAASIAIADLRLNLVNFPVGRKRVSIFRQGNQICLRVESLGSVIIVE